MEPDEGGVPPGDGADGTGPQGPAPTVHERSDSLLEETGDVMNPDHPLLARTQAALKHQLDEARLRVEGELREKSKLLDDAQKRREALGVELFNFQQQLAKLQMSLETAHEHHTALAAAKEHAQARVAELKAEYDKEHKLVKDERIRADKFQEELDRQHATLRQIEAYNEEMKNEIAITRRATYKAEEAVQTVEKEKLHQDNLIDKLQENLKSLHQSAALYSAQIDAQKRETRAAMETLVEAEKEMESIHFEKRQLVAQWRSSLLAIRRREEALTAIKDALHQQQEQELSIVNEISRFRKDIREQQIKHETLTSVMEKLEGELANVQKNIDTVQDKATHLNNMYLKLEKAQNSMDEKLKRCALEKKALEKEVVSVDKAFMKASTENAAVEEKMINVLGDQTTVEKGSGGTAKEIQATRKGVREKELRVVTTQNEIAKLTVDVLNTEAHNLQLDDTLKLLDDELKEKADVIDKYEVEIRRRNDEIEKKTRHVDALNRKLEKLVCDMDGEDIGPLEATINNLTRELQRKDVESKDLQRHWINLQTELVAKQNENARLTETQARLTSNYSILFQKKIGLEKNLDREQKEMSNIEKQLLRLNQDMTRLNSLISKNQELSGMLEDETFNLERNIMSELKELEAEAVTLENNIDNTAQAKKDKLAEILETEHQIMLWERKIQLEREMQEMLDPTVGQDVVGSMKKEIHRMEMRQGELERTKEQLLKELERAIEKRDTIQIKGRANMANGKRAGGKLTEKQLEQKCEELKRSIRDTQAECAATDERVRGMDAQRGKLADQMERLAMQCVDMRAADAEMRGNVDELVNAKTLKMLQTSRLASASTMLERARAGSYEPVARSSEELAEARDEAARVQSSLVSALQRVAQQHSDAAPVLSHIMMHAHSLGILQA